jgi:hypothetical protein
MNLGRTLRSTRLAAVLLALLAGFVLLGFVVPQRVVLGTEEYLRWAAANPVGARLLEAVGLDSVFTSWAFVAVVAALVVNLIACTWHRLVNPPRRVSQRMSPPPSARRLVLDGEGASVEGVLAGFSRPWRMLVAGDGVWVLLRGEIGWWGSILMHAGIVVLALAGIVSALTRFSGTMLLTEGQTLRDAPDSYVEVSELPRWGAPFGDFEVTLERMAFTYDGDQVTDAVALTTVAESGVARTRDVRVNRPFRVQGKSLLVGKGGYSVRLNALGPDGAAIDSFVNLGNAVAQGYQDTIALGSVTLDVLAVPDYDSRDGSAYQKLLLRDPAVRVAAGGESVWLRPGEQGEVAGVGVAVADFRLWNTYLVRADRGLPIAYVAFGMVFIGAVIRWLDPDGRVILFEDGPSAVWLWFRDRHGSHSAAHAAGRIGDALASTREEA